MDINKLREVIRIGEFLEENYDNNRVRSQWIFRVEEILTEIGENKRFRSELHKIKNSGGDKFFTLNSFNTIMGFLRHTYDKDGSSNKLVASNSQAVFIVHGHDDNLIREVKDCVADISLEPIVLRERADKGLTIIEGLEDCLGNCKCAIILYTPCDTGKAITETDYEERARQNVVYEHGLFQGYLGRKRIIILRKGDTELPSDCGGVVYTSVDNNPNWKKQLQENIDAIDGSI